MRQKTHETNVERWENYNVKSGFDGGNPWEMVDIIQVGVHDSGRGDI